MTNNATKVAVLMAVKDGVTFLPEQVDSILHQKQCRVSLIVSDDFSTDGSTEYLQKYSADKSNITLLPTTLCYGSAAKNFYRLILDVELDDFDYIAFADQDDIWYPDKLLRHIQLAKEHNADGVSSNVNAFWSDGREKLLDKAQPQRELDFLFESSGPGCTFLMTPWLINTLRKQLLDVHNPAQETTLHDWLTYAVCRANGRKWIINSVPSVNYRQHQTNVVGANVGITAKWTRLQKLKQRWYRDEVIKITKVCYKISANPELGQLIKLLENKTIFSQLQLLFYVSKARRKLSDRFLLTGAILTGLF
jgi:rhamnosyltransferase